MCKIGIMLGTAGENIPSAILFMNSNKSEKNMDCQHFFRQIFLAIDAEDLEGRIRRIYREEEPHA